ncbi:hypothetical protein HKI87_06g44800 [Chloropicon roscoffensis]|uniref:Uncharacterized protein n=1 Tax=Chloropicon roscoffensis TaxID=1461544 RepID=A0A7S3FNH1_9CHLO|mmetsp:Transcript_283/g.913  ORF Transcript_283/g.913 Transcript_283/m.913 type:complete len:192 (+) Transcript_283:254-829(+)
MEEDRYVAEVGTNVVVSSSVKIPNNLKVRKKLDLWPIKLSAGLDYNFEKEEVTWVASCKDQILGGRVTLDLNHKTVNYSKDFDLSGGPSFRLQVQCPYNRLPSGQLPKPTVGINFTSGRGNRRVTSVGANSFDVRTKVPISRMLRAEVCGNVKLPMLRPQYTVGSSSIESVFDVEGRFEIHVAEVNALLYV